MKRKQTTNHVRVNTINNKPMSRCKCGEYYNIFETKKRQCPECIKDNAIIEAAKGRIKARRKKNLLEFHPSIESKLFEK